MCKKVRNSNGYLVFSGPVDEYGNAVQRTQQTHPYSYDGFVTWRGGPNEDVNDTIYSDRLWEQNYKKAEDLCVKHFGDKSQYFSKRDPKKIQAFLQDWCNNPKLKLIFIMEYCNQATGYPVWRFDFNS